MRYKDFNFRLPVPEWNGAFSIAKAWLPSRGNVLLVVLAFAVLFWTQQAGALTVATSTANSSGTIAYQGRLASADGAPLTQTIGMEFRLYSAATGGTPLWTEQWTGSNSVQVSDGLFNVMLGSLTPIPQSVIAANSNLFLGITVGTDSEMSPRVQLGSVPFAVQALTVPDGSITTAKLAEDVSLVPPDGSITTAKIANGAVTREKLAENALRHLTVTRQNDMTNVTRTKTIILTGWGYLTGANSTSLGEYVQFDANFTEKPIVFASYAGQYAGNSAPTDIGTNGDYGSDNVGWIHHLEVRNISTSNFWVAMKAEEGHSFSAGHYYLYTWIAIGQVP